MPELPLTAQCYYIHTCTGTHAIGINMHTSGTLQAEGILLTHAININQEILHIR